LIRLFSDEIGEVNETASHHLSNINSAVRVRPTANREHRFPTYSSFSSLIRQFWRKEKVHVFESQKTLSPKPYLYSLYFSYYMFVPLFQGI
jgi:hypothetical protein